MKNKKMNEKHRFLVVVACNSTCAVHTRRCAWNGPVRTLHAIHRFTLNSLSSSNCRWNAPQGARECLFDQPNNKQIAYSNAYTSNISVLIYRRRMEIYDYILVYCRAFHCTLEGWLASDHELRSAPSFSRHSWLLNNLFVLAVKSNRAEMRRIFQQILS